MHIKLKAILSTTFLVTAMAWTPAGRAGESQSLAGPWQIRLDAGNCGVSNKWFAGALPSVIAHAQRISARLGSLECGPSTPP